MMNGTSCAGPPPGVHARAMGAPSGIGQVDGTMKIEAVLQGIEARILGEVGIPSTSSLETMPAQREPTVAAVSADVPELNTSVTDRVVEEPPQGGDTQASM